MEIKSAFFIRFCFHLIPIANKTEGWYYTLWNFGLMGWNGVHWGGKNQNKDDVFYTNTVFPVFASQFTINKASYCLLNSSTEEDKKH